LTRRAGLSSPFWLELEPVVNGRAHFVSAWNGYDLLRLRRVIEDIEEALLGLTRRRATSAVPFGPQRAMCHAHLRKARPTLYAVVAPRLPSWASMRYASSRSASSAGLLMATM
jgi:hypothetical protein